MSYYIPGTQEKDLSKVIMSLQQTAAAQAADAANIATNATNIATNTASIGTINSTLTALSGSAIKASLVADVLLNNTANYFDGPSVAQGPTGTWFVCGTVSLVDPSAASTFFCKLWDGTTVLASAALTTGGAGYRGSVSLSGFISGPAGNLRISCREPSVTTGSITANATGNSKDSTITAFRIA